MQPPSARPRFYGRRAGRRLSPLVATAMAEAGGRYAIPQMAPGQTLDLAALFGGGVRSFALEIGFGMGEHLLRRAVAMPETGFLGVEPFRNGVAKLVHGLCDAGLEHVRIWNDDVHHLLPHLPMGQFDAIFILFPDPWPKRRHHHRRLIQPAMLAQLHDLLRPGGRLVLASDDGDYQRWMLWCLQQCPGLVWTAERCTDWMAVSDDAGTTGYQRRAAAAGRTPVFLDIIRKDSA